MSEQENELKKALAENGNFDAAKAENEANQARRWFESRLKWSGRFAWMRIILVIVAFEFFLTSFVTAASTRAMIGYAAGMVITLVLVGTIAVQSWVAGTKISLLREIKLLRLECLGRPAEQAAPTDWKESPVTPSTRRALSVREYSAWFLALVVIAGASGFVTARFSTAAWPSGMARFEGRPVTIEAPRTSAPSYVQLYLRMDKGACKVLRITPDNRVTMSLPMSEGSARIGLFLPGDSLRLDPQGNKGEYWVRFE